MNSPTVTTVRHGAAGRGTKKIAGTRTAENRSATKRSGGTPSIPQSMTTKLKPQIAATNEARAACRGVMQASLGAIIVKHQRILLHLFM